MSDRETTESYVPPAAPVLIGAVTASEANFTYSPANDGGFLYNSGA